METKIDRNLTGKIKNCIIKKIKRTIKKIVK